METIAAAVEMRTPPHHTLGVKQVGGSSSWSALTTLASKKTRPLFAQKPRELLGALKKVPTAVRLWNVFFHAITLAASSTRRPNAVGPLPRRDAAPGHLEIVVGASM